MEGAAGDLIDALTGNLCARHWLSGPHKGVCRQHEDRPNVSEVVSRAQEFEVLRQAINALPERCREIMTLQKIQGQSNAEIATRLGISIHTVNAQMVTGLMRCRDYLKARGILRGKP